MTTIKNVSATTETPAIVNPDIAKGGVYKQQDVQMTSGNAGIVGENTQFGDTKQRVDAQSEALEYSVMVGGSKKTAALAEEFAANAIDTVNDALKNLQKNSPGAKVDLDSFPNPVTYSKDKFGKEAFNRWKAKVTEWRNNSMVAINSYSDKTVNDKLDVMYQTLAGGQKQIVNQLIDLGIITEIGFNALAQQMNNDINKVIKYVRLAKEQVIKNDNMNAQNLSTLIYDIALDLFIQNEVNRGAVIDRIDRSTLDLGDELGTIKNEVINNGIRTGYESQRVIDELQSDNKQQTEDINTNTDQKAKETQELDASGKRISDNLNSNATTMHTTGTLDKMGAMREAIVQANLSHQDKMAFMDKLEQLSLKVIIRDADMDNLAKEISQAIQ